MYDTVVDCKGLACPQPIIRLRDLLSEASPETLLVIVDNEPALENVCRFLASNGYATEHTADSGLWRIAAFRGKAAVSPEEASPPANPEDAAETGGGRKGTRTLVLIASPTLGVGDDDLGIRLMRNFIATLPELGPDLWRLVFLNGGVRLVVNGSPVLDEIRRLEASGARIMACGDCLRFFELMPEKALGETTNMLDIVTSMQVADKIIRV